MGKTTVSAQDRKVQIDMLNAALTEEEKTKISKIYPLQKERDRTICAIRARGVAYNLLAEVTGLSCCQLMRIAREGGLVKPHPRRKAA